MRLIIAFLKAIGLVVGCLLVLVGLFALGAYLPYVMLGLIVLGTFAILTWLFY